MIFDSQAIQHTLFDAFLKYGIPALLLAAVFNYLSAKMSRSGKKRKRDMAFESYDRPALPDLADLKLKARRPLSPFEEKMFIALSEAVPECTILAQVSFQALLDTSSQADRNRFDRKYADFLVCSNRLTPIAVVELDDASHDMKWEQDADRDAMLQNAGYQTIRYRRIPSAERIKADIEAAQENLMSC